MKKKGFTLVELLAVIVILAVLVLITVPIVLNSVESARKNAFKDSVYQAFSQIQYYLVKHNLEKIPEEGIEVKNIEFKNNNFISGRLIEGQSGNIKAVNVSDGRYCAAGEKDTLKVYNGACDLDIPTCTLKTKEQVGIGGWYAINPIVVMNTMPVKSGFLTYGIGLSENYNHQINGVGKVGTAEYQTTGDQSVTVYCYVQNISEIKGSNQIEIPIDKTAPTTVDFSYHISGRNLTIVATASDAESGIAKYQFSKDNGSSWSVPQSSNTYTFESLDPTIYSVKVRAYNGTYIEDQKTNNLYKDSDVKQISMAILEIPSYSYTPNGWTASNVDVTVHFNKDGVYLIKPSLNVVSSIDGISCSNVHNGAYTCTGDKTKNLQAGIWYQVESSPTLTFTENGSIIAQVSDGLNYKSGSVFNVSNIDRVKPVATIKEVEVSAGIEGWYNSVSLQVDKQSSGPSGIASWHYCITSDETCDPTTEVSSETDISIDDNTVGQKLCGKIISTTEIESDVVCSSIYKVDSVPPTAEFSMTGVTCNDNNEIHPDKAGTTWTLSGTSNVTKTYECQDKAGNIFPATRTYIYNSCKTGSNTCQGGYDQTWSSCATTKKECTDKTVTDYSNCTNYSCTLYKSCTLSHGEGMDTPAKCQLNCASAHSGGKCMSATCTWTTSGRQSGCGTETVTGSACNNANSKTCIAYGTKTETTCTDVCQAGYVNGSWNSCKTGSNTCQGEFE